MAVPDRAFTVGECELCLSSVTIDQCDFYGIRSGSPESEIDSTIYDVRAETKARSWLHFFTLYSDLLAFRPSRMEPKVTDQ